MELSSVKLIDCNSNCKIANLKMLMTQLKIKKFDMVPHKFAMYDVLWH